MITAAFAKEGKYRGRFAPSPTGPLHFGSLVAAVGSFLEARTHGGEWLVRIEDLDPPRIAPGTEDLILRTLEACGMGWNGAVAHQSARRDAYHGALHRLREKGLVYPCACSRREIADSAVAGVDGPVYPGTCRAGLPPAKIARALRLDTRGARVAFDDALQGHIAHDLEKDFGDFVLLRADDVYAYQLAVVVDDAEQGITDVVRGADLLGSTPRQIYLQQRLGLPRPRYAHLPVAVNAAGEKLSKQTLAAPFDAKKPLPALIAALSFLGQQPPRELSRGTVGELWNWAIGNWRLDRVPRAASLPAPAYT
ncbi:MAG: tRNA glutamyl-Q(34) synthetase GluQRS [Betaproteobacteria bacterium]|nr:tRNA glutamyl-Q(34) synthetase GluQRS [Betaproteobacteria bacterium]